MNNAKASRSILWFSRGLGFGHVMRDLAVAEKLQTISPDISILFCSYAHGAQALESNSRQFIDLHLPANNPFFETLARAGRLIHAYRPNLVISDEEFAVLPPAYLFNVPALFITNWFLEENHFLMQSLTCAEYILFIEEQGHFEVPSYLAPKVTFVGPILRPFNYTLKDRPLARRELNISENTKLISVFQGAWSEAIAPAFQLVIDAFSLLPYQDKLLIWIAGSDSQNLRRKVKGFDKVMVKEADWQIDRLMVATDLAITKSNYTTVLELDFLGIPSIALLHGHNPIDETYAKQRKTVTTLELKSLSSETLAKKIESLLTNPPCVTGGANIEASAEGLMRIAQFIEKFIAL